MRKEIPMSDVANQVATKRYYAKDSKGNCTEDWSGLVSRVVTYVCGKESGEYKEKISNLMLRREFLPNSPCLVNAGNNVGGLLACQPGWVRINTDKGLFRIQDIVEFDGDFELQTFFGPAKINKRWCNGKKEVFRYETEKGYRLDCTLDHRVYAVRDYSKKKHLARASLLKNHTEWVRAEDLRLGDALVLDFSEKRFSEDYVKVSVKNSVSTIVVDEDLARIIAYAKCDGHLAYHQSGPKAFGNTTLVFELIVDSPQALDLIRKSKYIHGNEISISNTDGNEHLKRIRAYGKSYAPLLALGEYGSLTCDIPDFIFHSPKSVVRSFIQAAFECEGTLSFGLSSKTGKRIGHIAIGMTSEDFIRDLQRLLNMFGIQSSISGPVRDKRTDFQRNPMFYLSITNAVHMARFMDEIGFISDKKNGLANAYLATVNTSKKYDKFAFEIKKIAPLGQHTVFDLSTSNETYLCEGIVVHNCFVTAPPEDCWHNPDGVGMIENIANFGHIARRGGGCGVSFSGIRPEGDPVFGSTHAKACGPIEHMRMISEVMSSITQAGFRGMAMMGTLSVSHPDVLKFIVCKQRDRALRSFLKEDIFNHYEQIRDKTVDQLNIVLDKFLSNFNISVVATDNFMRAVEKDLDWDLRFNGKVYSTVKARQIFDLVVENAWKNGDPGLLFWDAMNRGPYQYSKQMIDATNPCGEQVLPSWGSCNLGSIDVAKFYDPETEEVDWPALREAIHVAVQFLDNVIEVNKFPTSEFKEWAFRNRPVGLGIMGFADLLLKLKIAYGCPTSIEFAGKLGAFFEKHAHQASLDLAHDRGTPECCKYDELGHRRNATTISIAPTGTISMLAGCQSSIEPFYAPTVMRYDNTGSYQMPHPDAERAYFRSAINENENKEVHWKQHIEIQAAFQKHCDSAISKTINMRKSATVEDVRDAYLMAWKRGCKGITIYRDGSKSAQVLNTKEKTPSRMRDTSAMPRPVKVPADIYKRSADGFEWHIIIGLVEGTPYEVFAVNGQQGDLPDHGYVIRKKSRYYTLTDTDNNVLIENIAEAEQELDPRISLETRRFSLELRYGIQLKYIVEQIDKSCAIINSFAKVINRVFKSQYLTQEELQSITQPCPWCAKNGRQIQLVNKAGCWQCPLEECGFAKCG